MGVCAEADVILYTDISSKTGLNIYPFLSPQVYQKKRQRRKRIQSRQHNIRVPEQSLRSKMIAELGNKLSTSKTKWQIFWSLCTALMLKSDMKSTSNYHVCMCNFCRSEEDEQLALKSHANRTWKLLSLSGLCKFFADSCFKAEK